MSEMNGLSGHRIKDSETWYAVKHVDDSIRAASRSGGVFTAISDCVLKSGGRVYGCKLEEDFSAAHTYADTREERDAFRGSKYIQSDMRDTFKSVAADLKDGKLVLFSGTPCQTAALRQYVDVTCSHCRNKLILLDIVCHGVPSTAVWKRYLQWIERKKRKQVCAVDFRNKKDFGWADHVESVCFHDGTAFHGTYFRYLYYRSLISRPSCHQCPYTGNYYSDITIADCWGIEKIGTPFHDDKGVSLVILNSEVGKTLFAAVKEELNILECTPKQMYQQGFYKPYAKSEQREEFWRDYKNIPFGRVIKKYARDAFSVRVKRLAKRILHKGDNYDKFRVNR